LEEYRMYEDNPDEVCVDRFIQNLWPGHPLGRPVIGPRGNIRRFTRTAIGAYWAREFRSHRLLVSIAGAYDAEACRRVIERRFGALERGPAPLPAAPPAVDAPRLTFNRRAIEQAHFCFGTQAPNRTSPDRYAFGLMNMILGGGLSSRLFQEIREKRGLAYSIGSFVQSFSDQGCFAVNGGTSSRALPEVLRIAMDEIDRLSDEDVPEEELVMAREQMVDALLMGLENTEARTSRLAESTLAFGRVPPVDEVIGRLKSVEPPDIRRMARRYLRGGAYASSFIVPRGCRLPPESQELLDARRAEKPAA
ncbi:MAG: insulinase family protein, partial [bacterium]|nr:insulinase family protein [bacterium]